MLPRNAAGRAAGLLSTTWCQPDSAVLEMAQHGLDLHQQLAQDRDAGSFNVLQPKFHLANQTDARPFVRGAPVYRRADTAERELAGSARCGVDGCAAADVDSVCAQLLGRSNAEIVHGTCVGLETVADPDSDTTSVTGVHVVSWT
eukprot:SAG31_NODE_1238_length_9176_cov_9.589181_2_plen_145_part_00